MLTVIPGMSYLKTLAPSSPVSPTPVIANPETRIPPDLHQATVLLVTVALNVAFGARPLAHIGTKLYSATVRIHVSARRRQYGQRGNVKLGKLHIRPQADASAAEVYGTATVHARTCVFAARLERNLHPLGNKRSWAMVALRIF